MGFIDLPGGEGGGCAFLFERKMISFWGLRTNVELVID